MEKQEQSQSTEPLNAVCLYVTGFGKFADILENPSSHLVRALPELFRKSNLPNHATIVHSEIVTVSI